MTVSYNRLDDSEATVLADIDGSASPKALCDVYLVLDLTTKELYWLTTNACERNSTPVKVWHGRALRWRVPGVPTAVAADALADAVLELCETICAGYTETWDGSNHVGKLYESAQEASEAVNLAIQNWDCDEGQSLSYSRADEWLGGNMPDGDKTPHAIVAEALDDGAVLDVGEVEAYLLAVAEGRDAMKMNRTSTEIRSAIEAFLENWDRNHWLYHNGDWTDDGETMISRVVDPDNVAKSAEELGVEEDSQEWNCNEMWEAYRAGDALYLRWQRYSCCGERIPRDLWVRVDAAYFESDD